MKSDGTPVTKADTEISLMVKKEFRSFFPTASLISEETGSPSRCSKDTRVLVVDELDGTSSYTHGMPLAVFAAAFMRNHTPTDAIIYAPLCFGEAREYTVTVRGISLLNKKAISVSSKVHHQLIALAVSTAGNRPYVGFCVADELSENYGMKITTISSISHACAMLASGHIEGVLFPWGSLYDVLPGYTIVSGAGGVTSDLCGEPLDFSKDRVISRNGLQGFIMANNRETLAILLETVQKHRWKS